MGVGRYPVCLKLKILYAAEADRRVGTAEERVSAMIAEGAVGYKPRQDIQKGLGDLLTKVKI
ncbi:MAG: hypothetical protein H6868_07730 [Rhodospirillales bacterium]|nr:hypothetical protein [Rhodospirillales bacterium]